MYHCTVKERLQNRTPTCKLRKLKEPKFLIALMRSIYFSSYHMKKLDLQKKKVQFVRDEVGTSQFEIPNALIEKKIPDNAAFELEQFFKYIIKKYAI